MVLKKIVLRILKYNFIGVFNMGISKKKDESYQQWRDRTINKISPSFCGAKWYNATVWLNSGTTASCHHPPAHKIPLEEVLANPKAIHNTNHNDVE